ncbi:MAG: YqiA/YcfP family alpha/beta fold hydrolase [Acidobacteriota bacterium]
MKKILYLHGFASSPAGRKIAALRSLLENDVAQVVAPDLNVPSFLDLDFEAMVRVAVFEAERHRPAVVVGSSLGALIAIDANRRGVRAPLLLIAPAIGFGNRWVEKLPAGDPLTFFHHSEGREMPIRRRFFESLAVLQNDDDPPAGPVAVVMGTRDESVPIAHVREVWRRWDASGRLAPGSRFLEIAGGDHGLVDHAPLLAAIVVDLLSRTPPD